MTVRSVLELLKKATSEELRELGETFTWAADQERGPAFFANIDLVIAKFRDPKEDDLVERMRTAQERMRKLEEPLIRDGLDHRRLMAEELARRGDSRTVDEYLRATDAVAGSDVERASMRTG